MRTATDVAVPRGQATRAAILEAARTVFRRKTYHRTTVDDIAEAANIAHGTFYRYFCSKQDALRGLASEAVSVLQPPDHNWDNEDVQETVRDDIAGYFRAYRKNRDLCRIWTEAASYDDQVAAARLLMRKPFVDSIEKSIALGIERNAIPQIDVPVAAEALAGMVESFAYNWFVVRDSDGGLNELADTVALLWCRALGYTQ